MDDLFVEPEKAEPMVEEQPVKEEPKARRKPPVVVEEPTFDVKLSAGSLAPMFKNATARRIAYWGSIYLDLEGVAPRLQRLAVDIAFNALRPGGKLYLPPRFRNAVTDFYRNVKVDKHYIVLEKS